MSPFDQCLERVNHANNIYYFLVKYKSDTLTAKSKNLIYPEETLEFYNSLSDTNEPEIWLYLKVIIDGERYIAEERLTEQQCAQLVHKQFWQDEKRNLRMIIAIKLMAKS